MKKQYIYLIFLLIIVFLGLEAYGSLSQHNNLNSELSKINIEYEALTQDNQKLNYQIEYFSDPRNLEKELRSKFNYRYPNEKLIIVPKQ